MLLQCGVAIGAQLGDLGIDGAHGLIVALIRRQRQQIVERAELGGELLGGILLAAHQIGERRILSDHARAGIGERLLDRMAAHGVGQSKGLDRDVVRWIWLARQNADIGLDHPLQAGAARGDQRRIVVVGFVRSPPSGSGSSP